MKQPRKLLNLAALARRLGLFYTQAYNAYQRGDLIADFVDGVRPLFEESRLTDILITFRKTLTAEEYLTLSNRLCDSLEIPLPDRLRMVDVTSTAVPGER